MMFYSIVGVICVAAIGLADNKLVFPGTVCKRDSSDYSKCLLHAIKEAWPGIVPGLQEFDFPSLDPLIVKYAKFMFNTSEIYGEAIMSNCNIKGFEKLHFIAARTNLTDDVFRLEVDVFVPRLYVQTYNIWKTIFGPFKMDGEGMTKANIRDITMTWDFRGPVSNNTWHVEKFIIHPQVGYFKIFKADLFDIKELNDLVINFVNLFWPFIYERILPDLNDIWEPWNVDIANRLFSKVSFSALFP